MERHKLCIIVPFRDRDAHLKEFVPAIRQYLADSGIDHEILVVEQTHGKPFNRAKLLNIGFLEASKDCDYFVMHDVDMIPFRNLVNNGPDYSYRDEPTHLASAASQFNFTLPYGGYFGGVTLFPRKAFDQVNGYSNEYWGWGAEDDDMLYRCHYAGLKAARIENGFFQSLNHDRKIDEQDYRKNIDRVKEMWDRKLDWKSEGLNSCKYEVKERADMDGYGKAVVEI